MNQFSGKVVLVTGAGRGVGRAISEAFAGQGAQVAVNDINPDRAIQTVSRIIDAGGQAQPYLVDISKKMPVQVMVNQIEDEWGKIDCLVNNAGVAPQKPLLDMDEWDWRRTMDVNLTGAFLTTQVIGRMMRARGAGGAIVNIISTPAQDSPPTGHAAFLASQAGLIALTRQSALELVPYEIRINAVCPTMSTTDPVGGAPRKERADWQARIPKGLPGTPAEVAGLVLFVCSESAPAGLNGQVIYLDGSLNSDFQDFFNIPSRRRKT